MRHSPRLFIPFLLLTTIQSCFVAGSYEDGKENDGGFQLHADERLFRISFGKPGWNSGGSGGAGGVGGGSFGGAGGGNGPSGGGGRRTGDERFPPLGQSYWVPYGDRTVAAMSFPVVTHDLFTPVVIKEVLLPLDKAKSLYRQRKQIMKTKSDFGVVVSRNAVLKRNFRDYARLSTYSGDSRAPDELLVDLAKGLAHSQTSRRTGATFVAVAFESRLKNPSRQEFSGAVRDSRVLHNGTLIFPSREIPGILTTIPFTLKSLQDVEEIFGDYNGLEVHQKMQTKSFVKLLAGIHKDAFEDGRDALERFEERSLKLKRPFFDFSVENTTTDLRDDLVDRQERDEILRMEALFREEAWFSTSSIGIRSISPPQFVENFVPFAPQLVEDFHQPHLHLHHPNVHQYPEKANTLTEEASEFYSHYSSNY